MNLFTTNSLRDSHSQPLSWSHNSPGKCSRCAGSLTNLIAGYWTVDWLRLKINLLCTYKKNKLLFCKIDIFHIMQNQKCNQSIFRCCLAIFVADPAWMLLCMSREGLCHWLTYQPWCTIKWKMSRFTWRKRGNIDLAESKHGGVTVTPGGKRTFRLSER